MTERIFKENIEVLGNIYEICVITTDKISDKILIFGDLQDNIEINIFALNKAFERLKEYLEISGKNTDNINVMSTGDMYGENIYHENGNVKTILGADGIPNYEAYNSTIQEYFITDEMFYVYGNHDIPLENKNLHKKILPSKFINLINGTKVVGIHGVQSNKMKYPSMFNEYNTSTNNILKDSKDKNKLDVLITHDCPKFETEKYGNIELYNIVCKYKPKIHIFGHCHNKRIWRIENDILFINTDRRFVLILPN